MYNLKNFVLFFIVRVTEQSHFYMKQSEEAQLVKLKTST